MKKLTTLFCICLLVFSCKEATEEQKILSESNGKINSVSVIIENDLWKGEIGDAIRKVLAAPVLALPQDEPQFSLNQIPPIAFDGFVRNNRTFLQIVKGKEQNFGFAKDPYAEPQLGVVISGKTDAEIIETLHKNGQKIVAQLRNMELKEKQLRNKKQRLDDQRIQKQLSFSIDIPHNYVYTKTANEDFFWIKNRMNSGGQMNVLLYEIPLNKIQQDSMLNINIQKVRDSIGKIHIQLEENENESYFKTEGAYTPYLKEIEIDGKKAFETRGSWIVTGQAMGGPFVNYVIEDKANNRYLVLEGFTYAPRVEKRNYIFELESILRSARIK